MAGRPAFKPTDEMRERVEMFSAYGIPAEAIAKSCKVSVPTLEKYFREELDNAATKVNANVAGFLFTAAKQGNVTAQIFWLKTRARWREAPTAHEITGAGGGPLEIVHSLLDDIDARQRDTRVIEHVTGKKEGAA